MNTQGFNIFIVDDDSLTLIGLRKYLEERFGNSLNISTFHKGESALKKIDENTSIVILDYYLENENGNDILQSIKKINPKTEVIMLSTNENMGIAIDSFRKGATDYVIKGDNGWKRVASRIYKIITYPLNMMVREFGVSKFMAIFLLTFLTMAIVVCLILRFMH